jgi:rod shape-determining protein MreD
MVRHPTSIKPTGAAHHKSSLVSLEPIDTSPFRRPSSAVFVWGSILLVWLFSLLPWRLWQPAPDLLLLVIAYWCLHEPRRVAMLTAFIFGLLMDVHDAGLLGEQALVYTLVAYGAISLARRLQHFNSVVQALHMLFVIVGAEAVSRLIHAWLAGEWAGWSWVWAAIFTTLLWPLADILLNLPQRRQEEIDSGAS